MSIRTDAEFYVEHAEGIAHDLDIADLADEHAIQLRVEEITDYINHELSFTTITNAAERKIMDAACDAFVRIVEHRRSAP